MNTSTIQVEGFESRLAEIDLSQVMKRVAKDTGLSESDLQRAEDLYRKFLTLIARYPGKLFVPPQAADYVWHTHIIFTRKYMEDCQKLFGEYLHHTPQESTEHAYEENTVALMKKDFGIDPRNYGLSSAELARAGGCGQG